MRVICFLAFLPLKLLLLAHFKPKFNKKSFNNKYDDAMTPPMTDDDDDAMTDNNDIGIEIVKIVVYDSYSIMASQAYSLNVLNEIENH